MDKTIGLYDEALILVGSEMILNGKIPYEDFWTMYGPAQYYLTAALYSVFEVNSIYLRLEDIFFRTIIVLCGFFIIEKLSNFKVAFFHAGLILLFLASVGFSGFPVFPATALSLLSVLLIINNIDKCNSWVYFISGILIGMAAIFRHDLGFYSFLSISAFIISYISLNKSEQGFSFTDDLNNIFACLYFLFGIIFIFVPISIMLLINIDIDKFLYSLFVAPSTNYPEMRYLPFPNISMYKDIIVYIPILILSTVILIFVTLIIRERLSRTQSNSLISLNNLFISFFTILLSLFFIKGLVRTEAIHMAPSILISIITLSLLYVFYWGNGLFMRSILVLVYSCSIIVMAPHIVHGMIKPVITLLEYNERNSMLYLCAHPRIERATCMYVEDTRLRLINFIKTNSLSTDKLFVGTGRHDKLFINDIDIYFLAERTPVTYWFQFEPGVQTTKKVQTEIIQEISLAQSSLIVLNSTWDGKQEPNKSRFSSGIKLLDYYLTSHYGDIAEFGTFRVLKRIN